MPPFFAAATPASPTQHGSEWAFVRPTTFEIDEVTAGYEPEEPMPNFPATFETLLPCRDVFEAMARANPRILTDWMKTGDLDAPDLALAAEVLGSIASDPTQVELLVRLAEGHYSPIVREGALLGLADLVFDDERIAQVVLRRTLEDVETSSAVREAAEDVLAGVA